jgi:hypothetical protein
MIDAANVHKKKERTLIAMAVERIIIAHGINGECII